LVKRLFEQAEMNFNYKDEDKILKTLIKSTLVNFAQEYGALRGT